MNSIDIETLIETTNTYYTSSTYTDKALVKSGAITIEQLLETINSGSQQKPVLNNPICKPMEITYSTEAYNNNDWLGNTYSTDNWDYTAIK